MLPQRWLALASCGVLLARVCSVLAAIMGSEADLQQIMQVVEVSLSFLALCLACSDWLKLHRQVVMLALLPVCVQ